MTILEKYLKIIDDDKLFLSQLDRLSSKKTLILQKLLWDHVFQLGVSKISGFSREDITSKLEKSDVYQKRVGCNLPLQYCRGKICIFSHPECATRKIKGVIYILRKIFLKLRDDE